MSDKEHRPTGDSPYKAPQHGESQTSGATGDQVVPRIVGYLFAIAVCLMGATGALRTVGIPFADWNVENAGEFLGRYLVYVALGGFVLTRVLRRFSALAERSAKRGLVIGFVSLLGVIWIVVLQVR